MPPFKFSLFRRHSLKAQLRQNMANTEEGFCMIFAMESGGKKSQALIRHENSEIFGNTQLFKRNGSMDWFKGKSTGNHGFYHQI